MNKPFAGSLAAMTWLALLSAPARAELITFEARGTIYRVDDPTGVSPFTAAAGDHYSFVYTFDTDTPGTRPSTTTSLAYLGYMAITAASLRVNGLEFALPLAMNQISINNDYCTSFNDCFDAYSVYTATASADELGRDVRLSMLLNVSGPTAPNVLRSLDLPTVLDATQFSFRTFEFNYSNSDARRSGYIYATVDEISAVPLPAAAWLLSSGLLAFARRRRAKRASLEPGSHTAPGSGTTLKSANTKERRTSA